MCWILLSNNLFHTLELRHAGYRLLSTMLMKILASEHQRRLKKLRFEGWRGLVRTAVRRRRALCNSMARIERRRLLRCIRPAFEFWKRLAFHKSAERAGVTSSVPALPHEISSSAGVIIQTILRTFLLHLPHV